MEVNFKCLQNILVSVVVRMGVITNLCIRPNSVGISDRGDMEVEVVNLDKLINIISDDNGFERVELGIILEYVVEEVDMLETGVRHDGSQINWNTVRHQ